jgi:SAM-dependent methyltransferase
VTRPYDAGFFEDVRGTARSSARQVIPILLDLLRPRSVVDVGCGLGTWLAEFASRGVTDVTGVDGEYVDRSQLDIPSEKFLAHDLTTPLVLGRHYDLVMSLEVAEHLPAASADTFVASLAGLGPVVLFSAAIPHQGGVHHVNEQWPAYWVERFARHEFIAIDCLRHRLWQDEEVAWFYAQNLFLLVRRDALTRYPRLEQEAARSAGQPLGVVHPTHYLSLVDWIATLHAVVAEIDATVPRGERIMLIDDDQLRWMLGHVRPSVPVMEAGGEYAGHPADDAAAVSEVERHQRAGARFVVIAWPAFWWLDAYPALVAYFEHHGRRILQNDRVIVVELG